MTTIIPLVEFTRDELKQILVLRDKRCISTGLEGTDAHEVLFKRSEKLGLPKRSLFWHPYNAVLLSNAFHIEGGATSALHSLRHLQHLLGWHGEEELNRLIDAIDLKVKPLNIEQWAWQRASKLKAESLHIESNVLYVNGKKI